MDKYQFLEITSDILRGKAFKASDLEEVVKKYPFCQTGQLIYYLSLLQKNDIQHYQRLRVASAYAGDRQKLKKYVELSRITQLKKSLPKDNPNDFMMNNVKIDTSHEIEAANLPVALEKKRIIVPKPTESNENRKPLETKTLSPEKENIKAELPAPTKVKQISTTLHPKQKTKQELIDQFIKNEPRITRSKSDFYDPVDYSKNSEIDKEDIVSETLAMIYFKQGNYTKAINTYKKLILKVPQKSSFFAAQIEKIKEVQNVNN